MLWKWQWWELFFVLTWAPNNNWNIFIFPLTNFLLVFIQVNMPECVWTLWPIYTIFTKGAIVWQLLELIDFEGDIIEIREPSFFLAN